MQYAIERQQFLRKPIEAVFPFFSDAGNLARITPPWLGFRMLTPGPVAMAVDARLDYRIRLLGVPVRWRTRITAWEPMRGFVDEQERGPYALWRHTHRFEPLGDGVLMSDRIDYALPFGALGRLAAGIAVAAVLARIFDYRFRATRELFG